MYNQDSAGRDVRTCTQVSNNIPPADDCAASPGAAPAAAPAGAKARAARGTEGAWERGPRPLGSPPKARLRRGLPLQQDSEFTINYTRHYTRYYTRLYKPRLEIL